MAVRNRQWSSAAAASAKQPLPGQPATGARRHRQWALLIIIIVAAVLRLGWPDRSPPGIHVDEASNAWNARCLLFQGTDQFGRALPIFYTPAFGDNRSSLFLYFIVPFQAALGMSPYTTRLPAAIGGVVSVWLIYLLMRRMFDTNTGLAAAGLLAIDPWHLQFTRYGHEASITPMLVLGSLVVLQRALTPLWNHHEKRGSDGRPAPTRDPRKFGWAAGLIAGMVAGASCYGYAAVRIYLPALLFLTAVLMARPAVRAMKDSQHRAAMIGAAIGFFLLFTPLAIKHLVDPAINRRAELTWVWNPGDSFGQRLAKVAARYPIHFAPDFLLIRGGADPSQAPPPGFAAAHWYAAPLWFIGLAALLLRIKSHLAARVLLLAVLAYPVSDLLNGHDGVNALRSFPGIWALVSLAAVGAVEGMHFLRRILTPVWAWVAIGAFAVIVCVTQAAFLTRFFGDEFNRSTYRVRGLDVQEAVAWLRPRFETYDAVIWTQKGMSFIYAQTLVYMDYPPQRWFSEPVGVFDNPGDRYAGSKLVVYYGKSWFLYSPEVFPLSMDQLHSLGRPYHAALIIRPGEMDMKGKAPIKTIHDPEGDVALEIYEIRG